MFLMLHPKLNLIFHNKKMQIQSSMTLQNRLLNKIQKSIRPNQKRSAYLTKMKLFRHRPLRVLLRMVCFIVSGFITNKHSADEIERELEPQPKLPKPSSPAVNKSAVRIKTTLDTPVKDQTEIPKTRQKTSDESKEILDKYVHLQMASEIIILFRKLKGKQDRVLALQLHSEINIRPQRRTRQPPKENVTPSRKIQKSPKVTNRRKTIAVSTIAIPTKPVRRKLPPTPKTEPRNQIKRRREVSTSSTTKQTSKQKSSEPTDYSDDLSICMKIQAYNSK